MSVQVRLNNDTRPFILDGGISFVKESEVLVTDAGRVGDIKTFTLMAQIAATKKWVPYTDEAATNGSGVAKGIYVGMDILEADIKAGDVVDLPILVGGNFTIDKTQLVFEGGTGLDDVFASGTIHEKRVDDQLAEIGIFTEATTDIDGFEN